MGEVSGESSGEFANRVALVTGSSSGIGEAIARRLSALGASVVINSASSVEAGTRIAAELGKDALYVQADIADKAAGERCWRPPWRASAGSTSW